MDNNTVDVLYVNGPYKHPYNCECGCNGEAVVYAVKISSNDNIDPFSFTNRIEIEKKIEEYNNRGHTR